jgi:hypothetical protein
MSPLVALLVEAGIKYGPDFVLSIIALLKKPDATIDDVEKLFATVKPYAAYGIPEKIG